MTTGSLRSRRRSTLNTPGESGKHPPAPYRKNLDDQTGHVDIATPVRLPIRKRLTLLVVSSAIGGLLFVPFFTTGSRFSMYPWVIFPVGSALVAALSAWGGLLAADKTNLPMPLLRPWEIGVPVDRKQLILGSWVSVLAGVLISIVTLTAGSLIGMPKNPGGLLVRLLTIPFAAIVTETFAHLLVLSVLVLWFKRRWAAIILSSLLFTLVFHGQAFAALDMTVFVLAVNFLFFSLTGSIYVRYGFFAAILAHAVGQLIALGIN